jgi:hypothetical protein
MNDLERQLKAIPTATPDDTHDQRMDRLFLESARRGRWFAKPIPLWQGIAACAVAVTLGYLYRGSQTPVSVAPTETTRTVYIVPASPEFQRAIQGSEQSSPLPVGRGAYIIDLSPFTLDSTIQSGEST